MKTATHLVTAASAAVLLLGATACGGAEDGATTTAVETTTVRLRRPRRASRSRRRRRLRRAALVAVLAARKMGIRKARTAAKVPAPSHRRPSSITRAAANTRCSSRLPETSAAASARSCAAKRSGNLRRPSRSTITACRLPRLPSRARTSGPWIRFRGRASSRRCWSTAAPSSSTVSNACPPGTA